MKARLEVDPIIFERNWKMAMEEIGYRLEQDIALEAPVDRGDLKNSIRHTVKESEVFIYMVDYGLYVEYGTPPHIIRPVEKEALAWGKYKGRSKTGKPMYATEPIGHPVKEVHHPGTEANPFIKRAISREFAKVVEKALKKYFR